MALHTEGPLHTAGHLFAFAVAGLLASFGAITNRGRVICLAIIVLLGCSIELAEHEFYGSDLEWIDICSDTVGTLLGYCFFRWQRSRSIQKP